MAKDDYHVIVYQILSYLYRRLKKGEHVDAAMLAPESPLFKVNKRYWAYIIYNLSRYGMIEGVDFIEYEGIDIPYAACLDHCQITPAGIEYLCDNSFMEKAKSFLKEIKEIVPFT